MTLAATTTVIVLFGDGFEIRAIRRLLQPRPGDPDDGRERFDLLTAIPAEDAAWDEKIGEVRQRIDGLISEGKGTVLLLIGGVPVRFDHWLAASSEAWPKLRTLRIGPVDAERIDAAPSAPALARVEDLTGQCFAGDECRAGGESG